MKYSRLVEVYQKLESTTKRLEKTYYTADFLKQITAEELSKIILLVQGRLFPRWNQAETGVSVRIVLKALNLATGIPINDIEERWKDAGDLGIVAEDIISVKKQSTLFTTDLTVTKVFENLKKLAKTEGEGAVDRKIQLIAELLTSAKPSEAKYIIKTVLEEMRLGIGEGTMRDAILWAFFGDKLNIRYDKEINDISLSEQERTEYKKYLEIIQRAYDISNDFPKIAQLAKTKGLTGLRDISLDVGKPIKVMLYQKAKDLHEAFERVGRPAAAEFKYDGFRINIHRKGDKINLFTRRLENVTKQFPDVVQVVKDNIKSDNFILDSEVIGIDGKTKKWLPFQNISQRIKRKYNIYQMIKDTPVMVNVFDAVQADNRNLINEPFSRRREEIERIVKEVPEKLNIARQIITSNEEEAEEFYKKSLEKGNEGIMLKNLSAPYKPGSRVGYGVKVKPVMETLDLVIMGAEWGQGKRARWLSSFTIACIDDNGSFLEIGKVGTGIKEKQGEGVTFEMLTNMLRPLVMSEKAKEVKIKPSVVIEINYEEIQKSPTYSSGFALRFPRVLRLRQDRSCEEISTLKQVRELYLSQRNK